jgi:hypothetical protein
VQPLHTGLSVSFLSGARPCDNDTKQNLVGSTISLKTGAIRNSFVSPFGTNTDTPGEGITRSILTIASLLVSTVVEIISKTVLRLREHRLGNFGAVCSIDWIDLRRQAVLVESSNKRFTIYYFPFLTSKHSVKSSNFISVLFIHRPQYSDLRIAHHHRCSCIKTMPVPMNSGEDKSQPT